MADVVVKVYSTPTCPWCVRAKDFLKEHNVEFEDLNVAEDEKARTDLFEKSGQMGVPVLDVGGIILVGFDKNALAQVLKLKT